MSTILTNQIELFHQHGARGFYYQARDLNHVYVHNKRRFSEKLETHKYACNKGQFNDGRDIYQAPSGLHRATFDLSRLSLSSDGEKRHRTVEEVFQGYAVADRPGATWNAWREPKAPFYNPKRQTGPPRRSRQPHTELSMGIHEERMEIICSFLEMTPLSST